MADPTPSSVGAALARLYDLDLVEDPGDLDLYLALAARTGGPILELRPEPAGSPFRSPRPATTSSRVDIDPAMLARAAPTGRRGRPRERAIGSSSSRPTCSACELPAAGRSGSRSSP